MADEPVEGSILNDIKQMLGQESDDSSFDLDITIHINSVFFDLQQIGVGPKEGFEIEDVSTTWAAYLGSNKNLNAVKSYIYLRTRLLFDPPTNGFLVTNYEKQIEKLEWRLMVEMDPPAAPSVLGEVNA